MIAPDPPAGWSRGFSDGYRSCGASEAVLAYYYMYARDVLTIRFTSHNGFEVVRDPPTWQQIRDCPAVAGPFDTLEAAIAAVRLLTGINVEQEP